MQAFIKIGQILTLGQWKHQQQKLGYDSIFHLYVIVELETRTIRIEKNSRVEISNNVKLGQDNRYFDNIEAVSLQLLFDIIEEYVGSEKMYRYDPFSTNCQHFVISLLDAVGLADSDTVEFVLQDAKELVESKILRNGTKYVTDIHAIMLHAIQGGKRKRRTVKR